MAAYGTLPIANFTKYDWRGGLSFWAIPTLFGLIIWLVGYKSKYVNKENKKGSNQKIVSTRVSKKNIVYFILFFGIQAGLNYAILAWLPSVLKDVGISEYYANTLMFVFIVFQTFTSLFFALLIKLLKMTHARALFFFTMIASIGVGSIFTLQYTPLLFVLTIGVATGGFFRIALLLPIDFAKDKSEATYLTGITQSGGYLIGGVLPWMAGVVADNIGIFKGVTIVLVCAFTFLCFVANRIMSSYKLID